MTHCRWDRTAEAYLTSEGAPCERDEYGDPTTHCTARRSCSWHVGRNELTCARCVNAARADLKSLGDLSALAMPQALGDGVASEAAHLAGPATDPRSWAGRRLAQGMHLTTWLLGDRITEEQAVNAMNNLEDDDTRHAERLVTTWARMIAEDYRHPLPQRMTLTWCVDYLGRHLHRIAQDPDQDFGLLRRELRKCRQHIEAVIHNDDKPDQGVPCPDCVKALAVLRADLEAREVPKVEWPKLRAPRLARHYPVVNYPHDRYDQWVCPRDGEHAWTHHAYVAYVEDRKTAVVAQVATE